MGTVRKGMVLASLGAVVLLASGCSREVSAGDIEDSIAEQAEIQGFELESVDCPGGLPPEVGAILICEVVITGEAEAIDRFRIEATEVDGDQVSYTLTPLTAGMSE
ncbi:DUF4333 domain-containing protein [Ornithinimicrobium sp. F0845]|uniref:DUF4333 domain-containing protein n=1 Tax=Ornithinimicrobium sp. F0845 TaxID=2926412 RepID=UPI001FF38508|nr:DUF4333 domain-containing protein [Ornithinimicrobium sp. F0845]MCK0111181.1 DUF4333 domain-containing protein [Ornithinimicrobium sp. F0845]